MPNDLDLVDILYRTAKRNPEDTRPLISYLDFEPKAKDRKSLDAAKEMATSLRRAGSNDFATLMRGGEGVEYAEIVRDVARKMGADDINDNTPAPIAEDRLLRKMFADAWDRMNEAERRELVKGMNIKAGDIPLGSTGTSATLILLKQFGGFATYRMALVVANVVARALLGAGLSFAANAALTRSIGALLGPIGLVASGAWLAVDLAGPAFRKTVPAVIYVAMLRQVLMNRVVVGVVGDGSAGKDALIRTVFELDSNIDPIAGSTAEAVTYEVGRHGVVEAINYPGFNDYRQDVNKQTDELLRHTDVFLLVVDAIRGISGTDVEIIKNLREFDRPILVCINKLDLVRDEKQKHGLHSAAKSRFGVSDRDLMFAAFDPDPRLNHPRVGAQEVRTWLRARLVEAGKESGARDLPK